MRLSTRQDCASRFPARYFYCRLGHGDWSKGLRCRLEAACSGKEHVLFRLKSSKEHSIPLLARVDSNEGTVLRALYCGGSF